MGEDIRWQWMRGSEGSGEDPAVEVHADSVVVFDVFVEQYLHQSMSSEGLFDLPLNK